MKKKARPFSLSVKIIFMGLLFAALALIVFLILPFFSKSPKDLMPFTVQNFLGEARVYSMETQSWHPPRRGETIQLLDRIETLPGSQMDLEIPNRLTIRVKENSQLEVRNPESSSTYRLHLEEGTLLAFVQENFTSRLEITIPGSVSQIKKDGLLYEVSVPRLFAILQNGIVLAQSESGGRAWLGVLQGSAKIRSSLSWKWIPLGEREKAETLGSNPPLKAEMMTQADREQLREGFELARKKDFHLS